MASYCIGIDLGTTNCALAYVPMQESAAQSPAKIFSIPQRESTGGEVLAPTLPSFLVCAPGAMNWEVGRRARSLAGEIPGRVISSAKSWLVHPAVDRKAAFLPFGSEDLPTSQRLSPVEASSTLLRHLVQTWDAAHPQAPLHQQNVAVTVPASFDPVAQQLTREAALDAGLPEETLLLEEPQAAFYAWLAGSGTSTLHALAGNKASTILVIDIGGGTTDFSLFVWHPGALFPLERIAVSDHILLGGDNLDLALAHFLEEKISPGNPLSATTQARLLTRCREIKEEALLSSTPSERTWKVSLAQSGASLLSGTLQTEIDEATVHRLLMEGFFPQVSAREFPLRSAKGLREVGLPYARDPAVTRHLADFLRDRPFPDTILFHGGTTKAPAVRQRLQAQLAAWNNGCSPLVLDNADADLSVALGAAWHLAQKLHGTAPMELGSSRAYYIGVGDHQAVCILPQGATAETVFRANPKGLRALVGYSVSLTVYQNSRRPSDQAGAVFPLDDSFQALPPVETLLRPPRQGRKATSPEVRVEIHSTLRSTGLLRLELHCAEPALKWKEPWPLDFNLRAQAAQPSSAIEKSTTTAPDLIAQTAESLQSTWLAAAQRGSKLTGNQLLSMGEGILNRGRTEWSGQVVRPLFDAWMVLWDSDAAGKSVPPMAEEAWWHLAGFLLRPGWGVPGDDIRMKAFTTRALEAQNGLRRSVKVPYWIALRRVAAGFSEEAASHLWAGIFPDWKGQTPAAEILLLAGSLESLPRSTREQLTEKLIAVLEENPGQMAGWRALGRILSRVLLHGGAERVLSPAWVETAWQKLSPVEVPEAAQNEAALCWLRAARCTELRTSTVSPKVRDDMGRLLRSWGWEESRRRALRDVIPLVAADHAALLGEAPPPGLRLAE